MPPFYVATNQYHNGVFANTLTLFLHNSSSYPFFLVFTFYLSPPASCWRRPSLHYVFTLMQKYPFVLGTVISLYKNISCCDERVVVLPPHHSGLCIHAYFAVCRWPVFTWGCCHLHFLAAADIVVVVFFFFSPFSTPFKSLVVRDQKGLQQPQQHQQRKRTVYILVEHSCIINCSHD